MFGSEALPVFGDVVFDDEVFDGYDKEDKLDKQHVDVVVLQKRAFEGWQNGQADIVVRKMDFLVEYFLEQKSVLFDDEWVLEAFGRKQIFELAVE